jgi:hypothetical protein
MGDSVQKRPYQKVRLHQYGSFTELTAGTGGTKTDAAGAKTKAN